MRRLLGFLFFLAVICTQSVSYSALRRQQLRQLDSLCIMSYNVENLFDTIDNTTTADEEFTPSGAKHWTKFRYQQKLRQIAQVIASAGGLDWPSVVGLIEVENASVIEDLLTATELADKGYRYVITDSPDPRGIDVALVYRVSDVKLLNHHEHPVTFSSDPERKSRNILEAELELPNKDRLYVYVMHWPSRREGVEASEPFRCDVARTVRHKADSIYQRLSPRERESTHFLMMGDFNEEANERAMVDVLHSAESFQTEGGRLSNYLQLFSLMSRDIEPESKRGKLNGSYCYRGTWMQLDQFVISKSLINRKGSGARYKRGSANNFAPIFVTSDREAAGFRQPARTYGGNTYLGGYSDHFPIVMWLSLWRAVFL